jgi:hypothetical protein
MRHVGRRRYSAALALPLVLLLLLSSLLLLLLSPPSLVSLASARCGAVAAGVSASTSIL